MKPFISEDTSQQPADIYLNVQSADQQATNHNNNDAVNDRKDHVNVKRLSRRQQRKEAWKISHPRESKKKKLDLTDPEKIVEDVLSTSSFRVANLSQIINEKFYEAPDYHELICKKLSEIDYKPTIGPTYDGVSDIEISVLPLGVDAKVNVGPAAIMNLTDMYETPPRRNRGKKSQKNAVGHKANKDQQQQRESDQPKPSD